MAPAVVAVERAAALDDFDPAYSETVDALEMSRRMGVDRSTIYRSLAAGRLPVRCGKLDGRWRISKADLDDFLAEIGQ